MLTTSDFKEPELSYVDALRGAREWVVANVTGNENFAPIETAFIGWYALNARRYTFHSAYDFFYWGDTADLVLRAEER